MRERGGRVERHVVLPAYRAAGDDPAGRGARCRSRRPTARCSWTTRARTTTSEVALRDGLRRAAPPGQPRLRRATRRPATCGRILDGADAVVMVHADNQYDPALVAQMVKPIEAGIADVVIGSRLLEDEAIAGGMPRWKWVGNRFLTAIENLAFRRGYSEYHTGYRAFSAEFLRRVAFLRNSRRLRLRPGDLRPDRRAPGARASSCRSPPATSSRRRACRSAPSVALRPRDARRARPLPAATSAAAAGRCCAPPGRAGSARRSRPSRARGERPRPARAGRRAGSRRNTAGAGWPARRSSWRSALASVAVTTRYLGAAGYGKLRAGARARADVRRAGRRGAARRSSCARSAAIAGADGRAGRQRARAAARARRVAVVAARRCSRAWRCRYDREVRVAVLIAGGAVRARARRTRRSSRSSRRGCGWAARRWRTSPGRAAAFGGAARGRRRSTSASTRSSATAARGRGRRRSRSAGALVRPLRALRPRGRARRLAARCSGRRCRSGVDARRDRDLLPRRHVHHLAVPRLRRGRRVLARLPGRRAARRASRRRDDLRVPAAVALPRPAATASARRGTIDAAGDVFLAVGVPLAAGGLVVAPQLVRLRGGRRLRRGGATRCGCCCSRRRSRRVSGLLGYALIAGGRAASALRLALVGARVQPRAERRARAAPRRRRRGGGRARVARLLLVGRRLLLVAGASSAVVAALRIAWRVAAPRRGDGAALLARCATDSLALLVPLGARRLRRPRCGRSAAIDRRDAGGAARVSASVLVVSAEPVGERMAGPAIRALELARALAGAVRRDARRAARRARVADARVALLDGRHERRRGAASRRRASTTSCVAQELPPTRARRLAGAPARLVARPLQPDRRRGARGGRRRAAARPSGGSSG